MLKGIAHAGKPAYLFIDSAIYFSSYIQAPDSYFTQVQHRPTKQVFSRNGHNFILYGIVIGVGTEIKVFHYALHGRCIHYTSIVLPRIFRQQRSIANKPVIQVVKSGHTEYVLIEQAQHKRAFSRQLSIEGKCWRKLI